MNRDHYHALRRAAFAASAAWAREAGSDDRSSYASHSIRCLHASRTADAARAKVPRARESVDVIQTAARRRCVIRAISDRNWRRAHAPGCLPFYEREIRAALHPLEVQHVRLGFR